MRLNPYFPALYNVHYARALFNLGRYGDALPHLNRIREAQSNHPLALALAAACYAANGQMDNAREFAGDLRRANGQFTVEHAAKVLPYELSEDRERFLSMFKLAMSE
jgi:predicted Zn-dependent protease